MKIHVGALACQSLSQEETTQEWKSNGGGGEPKGLLGVGVWGWGDASNLKEKITEQKISPV